MCRKQTQMCPHLLLQAPDYENDELPVSPMETCRYVTALHTNWDIFTGFRSREY